MRGLALVAALAACGDQAAPLLPGLIGDEPPTRRGENSPCTGTTAYGAGVPISTAWTYYYDELGRSSRDVGVALDGGEDEDDTYTWDHVDHLTLFVQTLAGRETLRMETTYDTLGNELDDTTIDSYFPDAVTVSRYERHDFDDHGNPAYVIRSYTGTPDVRMDYVYDEVGRQLEWTEDTGLDGTLDGSGYTVYDEATRVVTTTVTSNDGAHSLRTRTYDDRLHMVSSVAQRWRADGRYTSLELRMTWDGDRQLDSTFVSNGEVNSVNEYSYACPRRALRTPSSPVSR